MEDIIANAKANPERIEMYKKEISESIACYVYCNLCNQSLAMAYAN
jgi:hypothetical protein